MKIKRVIETEETTFYEGDIVELKSSTGTLIGRIIHIGSEVYMELDCSERFKADKREVMLKDFDSIKHYTEKR